ncbi:MAG TPA: hypothetical protein VHH91_12785 [Vicinamibacterales bacterium]|nr:hypothetical protein [Vicinamibacterales bacterium]
MWQQINRIMDRAAERTVEAVANFLPGLVLLAAILAVTIAVALVVRVLLRRALQGLDVDRRAADAGLVASLGLAPGASVSALIARSVQWMIVLVGVLIGLTALDAAVPGQLAMRVFAYLPDVLAALLILIAGMVLSRFLARSVLIGAVNLQLQNARLLAIGIKWLVLIMAVAMALEHLHIGQQILLVAFAILFGGVVLTMALAIGLGSKDLVARSWQQMRNEVREEDKLDHL